MTLGNDRLLKALARQAVDRTPVWMMRQAGRYLPEYRATRAAAGDFLTLCKTPELACEVTLQPLRRFDCDAAILFSDILTIPDALGQGLFFVEGEGPRFENVIRSPADVRRLPESDLGDELAYVPATVELICGELAGKVPLIGFCGSPWTLACYMIEGGGSKDFSAAKRFLYDQPAAMHDLLSRLAKAATAHLNAQIHAGVRAVQIFDTWGGLLSGPAYREFSLPYMARIVAGLATGADGRAVPSILFTRMGGQWLEDMAAAGAAAISLDWTCDLGAARSRVGAKVALQGNMDPAILYAEPAVIRAEVERILQDFGPHPGHVFNLGHGITPGVNPDHVAEFFAAVRECSAAIHGASAGGSR